MGLVSFMKKILDNNTFVTTSKFNSNCKRLIKFVPVFIDHMRNLGVTSGQELKLEYFFYTNTKEKAEQLANEISKLNYSVEFRLSAGDDNEYVVTGWSSKIKITNDLLTAWAKEMCDLGYKFDCDFDGWGTDPSDLQTFNRNEAVAY